MNEPPIDIRERAARAARETGGEVRVGLWKKAVGSAVDAIWRALWTGATFVGGGLGVLRVASEADRDSVAGAVLRATLPDDVVVNLRLIADVMPLLRDALLKFLAQP